MSQNERFSTDFDLIGQQLLPNEQNVIDSYLSNNPCSLNDTVSGFSMGSLQEASRFFPQPINSLSNSTNLVPQCLTSNLNNLHNTHPRARTDEILPDAQYSTQRQFQTTSLRNPASVHTPTNSPQFTQNLSYIPHGLPVVSDGNNHLSSPQDHLYLANIDRTQIHKNSLLKTNNDRFTYQNALSSVRTQIVDVETNAMPTITVGTNEVLCAEPSRDTEERMQWKNPPVFHLEHNQQMKRIVNLSENNNMFENDLNKRSELGVGHAAVVPETGIEQDCASNVYMCKMPENTEDNYMRENQSSYDSTDKSLAQLKRLVDRLYAPTRENLHTCETCGLIFASKIVFLKHMYTHIANCDVCGEVFENLSDLQKHIYVHYSCSTCHKSFTNTYKLKKHERIHTGIKPFVCESCGKRFVRSSDLAKHNQFHTEEGPYTCSICGKSFSRSYNMLAHVRLHTGQKQFVCDIYVENYLVTHRVYQGISVFLLRKHHLCVIFVAYG